MALDMVNGEQKKLIYQLTESHSAVTQVLDGINIEMHAHPDSDWCIRDILGHIAIWDREVTKSIYAFIEGSEYAIPDLNIDTYNQEAIRNQRELNSQQVYDEWAQARQGFIEAIISVPSDRYPGDMLYPWGDERGSLSLLVEYMVAHETEHKDEIVEAVQKAGRKR